jgi:hypothetical protein
MDAGSCSSSGVSSPIPSAPSRTNGSTTPSTCAANNSNVLPLVQPKTENSPPPTIQQMSYSDQAAQRQTVLMWGSGSSSQQASEDNEVTSSPSHTKSPTLTNPISSKPQISAIKAVSIYHENYNPSHIQAHSQDKINQNLIDNQLHQQQQHSNLKWNGTAQAGNKELVSIYPIHDNMEIYASANSHSSGDHQNLVMGGSGGAGSNCEVWPTTTYSQYQYFTYHHAPNHQQHASTQ